MTWQLLVPEQNVAARERNRALSSLEPFFFSRDSWLLQMQDLLSGGRVLWHGFIHVTDALSSCLHCTAMQYVQFRAHLSAFILVLAQLYLAVPVMRSQGMSKVSAS